MSAAPRKLSVVIPTLNEAAALPETVRRLRMNPEVVDIIVADGGSTDSTPAVARQLGCRVVEAPAGRGTQMRAGVALATGDAVLLLHADTWVPEHAAHAALQALADPSVSAVGFWKEFRDPPLLLRGSKFKCALRLWLGRRIAGDQGIALRRQILDRIGGVPDVPLMEEFVLCARARAVGRLVMANAVVLTSARRFLDRGILRTYALMWRITVRYWLGTPPEELRRLYNR